MISSAFEPAPAMRNLLLAALVNLAQEAFENSLLKSFGLITLVN